MNGKIAIVGMEAIFGVDEGLDAFDQTIFDGIIHSGSLHPHRPKKILAESDLGSGEVSFPFAIGSGAPMATKVLSKALEGALKNTVSRVMENTWSDIALIVVGETDLSVFQDDPKRFFQEDSISLALQRAQGLLTNQDFRGVLIGGVYMKEPTRHTPLPHPEHKQELTERSPEFHRFSNELAPGEGAGAIFLKRLDQARQDQDRIYAMIDALVLEPGDPAPGTIPIRQKDTDLCKEAFSMAGIGPEEIAYLEIAGKRIEEQNPEQIRGLIRAYLTLDGALTCALGSVKANVEAFSIVSGLAGLIKTAICLYHRYIPATPQWTGPEDMELWANSPFYVTTESRPWFLDKASSKRFAALHLVDPGGVAHMVLSEDAVQQLRPNNYLALCSPYFFPLSGDDQGDLMRRLDALLKTLEMSSNLHHSSKETVARFYTQSQAAFALTVLGNTREELSKEIQFMLKLLPNAFEKGIELKTPKGSYFTPNPLGGDGTVAFVYPGIGSAYVGLGQGLFHYFPEVYDLFSQQIDNMGELLGEKELYPRSHQPLTEDEILKLEESLRDDIIAMCNCATGFFVLYTMIMRDIFKVIPHFALGYSWGDPGMMVSLGVWPPRIDLLKQRLDASPLFAERLTGKKTAIREYWNLAPYSSGTDGKIWDSYTLEATPSTVSQAVETEQRVFMTIINSPEEVVIAGDPEDCLNVIKRIGCRHYPLGLDLAIHCDPARLEYDRIVNLFSFPIHHKPSIKFYSSSCYKSIPITGHAVAHSIARVFCEPVDFPRLVSQAYESGARIFIELGPRKFCSNMIERILKDKNYLAANINIKGVKDHITIIRLLAQLVSHRVSVDLSPLFQMRHATPTKSNPQ